MNNWLTRQIFAGFIYSFVLIVNAEVLVGKVVAVSDGDTITVLDKNKTKHKVRLMGIDAPEIRQEFGAQSKLALSNHIYQKEVNVNYKKFDKYKRIVGKVNLEKQDVSLVMIELGMASHYKDYEKEQSKADRDLYRQAELKSRQAKIGLWQDENAIEPSAFRHK